MNKIIVALLAVVAVAVVVIALAVTGVFSHESAADKQARDDATAEAEYYCSMDSSITSIYSAEFKACVKDQVEQALAR